MKKYLPEGNLIGTRENKANINAIKLYDPNILKDEIMEARVILCDKDHNLHLDLDGVRGIIPREECSIGISNGSVKDIAIISRVNKAVAFKLLHFSSCASGRQVAILSRRLAQEECISEYLEHLIPGDIIDAKITHLENFGAFCDVGMGVCALLPIDSMSVSRIPHPSSRFSQNDCIKVVVKNIDNLGRLILSHKELLGTWQENAEMFSVGETVPGIVRSIESYGAFIEITPNLAGLSEVTDGISKNQHTSVYIKSINPEKMKIKLIIVDCFDALYPPEKIKYFVNSGRIENWQYSPKSCEKIIETVF